ncbi:MULTISPECIES: hypothetical protein [unclassified Dietzia]|uniref:hypothetical protein n=1 Tax=unclassified Dietzia TaxID=2617939 RepID=UPI0015F8BEB4|nr:MULTISPECIES: hypothetical protein [unclassified Dietzia]MBB1023078.1 hypothetical protein [Dietzia sp. DQ12-76]MBB1028727.1 hypothetical protein [Dietzia sp. DQ11-38-2]
MAYDAHQFMSPDVTGHTIQVMVHSSVFQGGSLPPLHVDGVISVVLGFDSEAEPSAPGVDTFRVRVQPRFGHAPYGAEDGSLRWLFDVFGAGWSAEWHHHTPVAGLMHLTGRLDVGFDRAVRGHPGVVTGRIRRLQLVEKWVESTDTGIHYVAGTERLRDLDPSPDPYWPRWKGIDDPNAFAETGILVDLDLDDLPDDDTEFDAGAVAIDHADLWVIDRSNPLLLHIDTTATPPRVTEYRLPLAIEQPREMWTRRVHADRDGCWITSPEEIIRCTRTEDAELTVHRAIETGRDRTVDLDGRLYVLEVPHYGSRPDPRYGYVRVQADEHPIRELVDGELVPVMDDTTIARVEAAFRRADQVTADDGTTWIADRTLIAKRPDGTSHTIDLHPSTRGRVRWPRDGPRSGLALASLDTTALARFKKTPDEQ